MSKHAWMSRVSFCVKNNCVIFISKPSKLIRTNKVSNELYFLHRRRTILHLYFFFVAKSAPILFFFGCKPTYTSFYLINTIDKYVHSVMYIL